MSAYILFMLAVVLAIAPRFSELTGLGNPLGFLMSTSFSQPEIPALYTYAVWPVIFTLGLVFGVGQLLPGIRCNRLVREVRFPAGGFLLCSILWMLSNQLFGAQLAGVLLIGGAWAFALKALLVVRHSEHLDSNWFHKWVTQPLFGLSCGWLTVSASLETGFYLKSAQLGLLDLTSSIYALLLLTTIVAVGTTILLQTNGCRWFGGALQWALYGVVIHNLMDEYNLSIAVFTSVSVLLVAALMGITPLSRLFRYVRRAKLRASLSHIAQQTHATANVAWLHQPQHIE